MCWDVSVEGCGRVTGGSVDGGGVVVQSRQVMYWFSRGK
jgi:hypothetical protein